MSDIIKGFKGFNKDFKCRGFQFEVGKEYHHDGKVNPCESGWHSCESPVDVWKYYGPAESRYAVVEQFGVTVKHKEDSKVASSDIRIVKEISAKEFLDLVIARIMEAIDPSKIKTDESSAQIGINWYDAQIGSSGDYAKIGSSGNFAKIGSSGYNAQIEASGNSGVIACAGVRNTVKASIGTWISVAEFVDGKCVGFATGCIGQDGLLPDVWYKASGGKLVPNS